ncbi:MAG: hypothetical protein E6P95_00235 [Candidatus Moraniibacteriota bacterium]|nr:MAG: hypothetical protein E6P95_00235 [Candidatus Moranbacteria bacterium]
MITAYKFSKVGIEWLEDSDGAIARLFGDDAHRVFTRLYPYCDAAQAAGDSQITLDDRHLNLCEHHGWHPTTADGRDNDIVIFRFSVEDARLVIVTSREGGLAWISEFDVEVERRSTNLVIRDASGLIIIEI